MGKVDKSIETFSNYVVSLSYDDLPASVVQSAKRVFIDSMGCALAAYTLESSKSCRHLCPTVESPFSARVIGSLQRTTPEMAAFANATMVRNLDLNDVYRIKVPSHPSDMIPAVLALAEPLHANGKSVITSITAAYEMHAPFVARTPVPRWIESCGFMDTLGSAVGAAKILGLTKEQVGNAISLALVPNIGLGMRTVGELSMYKEVYAGMAARQGLFAALMAQAGITAPGEAIDSEGRSGLKKYIMPEGRLEIEPLGRKQGEFVLERTVVKDFPVKGQLQLTTRTVRKLLARESRKSFSVDEIESVLVKTQSSCIANAKEKERWAPSTREVADHSLPITVAIALLDGSITVETWERDRYKDSDVLALVDKMSCEEDLEFSKQMPENNNCLIEVKIRDGNVLTCHETVVTAEEPNIVARREDEDIEEKFVGLARRLLTQDQIKAFLDMAWNLEDIDDTTNLLDPLKV